MLEAELYSPAPILPRFAGRKLPWFQMIARVSPEGVSPALPTTSPKLLSRQGTPPAESCEIVYSVVCPNISGQIITPAVSAKRILTILVGLILFPLNGNEADFMYVDSISTNQGWLRH